VGDRRIGLVDVSDEVPDRQPGVPQAEAGDEPITAVVSPPPPARDARRHGNQRSQPREPMRAQLVATGLELLVGQVPAQVDEFAREHGPHAKPQDGQKAIAPPHRLDNIVIEAPPATGNRAIESQAAARQRDRAATRARLLEAAPRVFLRRGFRNASVEEIAAEAGFTTGAVYSSFMGKGDLLFTVLEQRLDRRLAELEKVAEDPTTAAAEVGRWFTETLERDPRWAQLSAEAWFYAAHDPKLRRRLTSRHAKMRRAVAGLIERQADQLHVRLPLPADHIALALIALTNGFALELITRRTDVPRELYGQTLALVFRGLLAMADNQEQAATRTDDAT
jgi:AcrR family transcriptional regulator